MQKRVIFLLFVLLMNNVYALCDSNQININTASPEELDKLTGIGPAKAQAIMDSRPFNSIDDLLKVSGIGEITIEKIKTQGIACVDENKNNVIEEEDEEIIEEKESDKENVKEVKEVDEIFEVKQEKAENVQKELIVLTSLDTKNIKTKENKEKSDNNYTIYGLIVFCIVIIILSIIKKYKDKKKNEFR